MGYGAEGDDCPPHHKAAIYEDSLHVATAVYAITAVAWFLAAVYVCKKRGNSVAIVLLLLFTLATVIKTLIFTGTTSNSINTAQIFYLDCNGEP